ncbi:glycosyltransferase [Clostridiaceae bacterium]|nr:glycosyltransferase [Clostridiaceae bacterium]RKI12934.1 glycosyltransferase [bacterium 1XD21-70]
MGYNMKENDNIKSSNIRISVVMTTYNGERYLIQQLNSIAYQTKKADEVLIFDDCSTDSTVQLIKDFINNNKLSNWYLFTNKINLGWRKNFIQGISKAKGDIIFLSDQDDIWMKNKIERMSYIMSENEKILILSCNVRMKNDENMQLKVKRAVPKYKSKKLEKVQLNGSTYRPIRPGCAYAFKKEVIPEIERLWFEGLAHDSLIWVIGLIKESLYILNEPLVIQVRHAGNNTPTNEKTRKRRKELLDSRKELSVHLLNNIQYMSDRSQTWIRTYIHAAESRILFLQEGGMFRYINLLRYIRYYPKFASWFGDYIAFRNKGV